MWNADCSLNPRGFPWCPDTEKYLTRPVVASQWCTSTSEVNQGGLPGLLTWALCQTQRRQELLIAQGGCSRDGSAASMGGSSDPSHVWCPFLLILQHLCTSLAAAVASCLYGGSVLLQVWGRRWTWTPKWGTGWEREGVDSSEPLHSACTCISDMPKCLQLFWKLSCDH